LQRDGIRNYHPHYRTQVQDKLLKMNDTVDQEKKRKHPFEEFTAEEYQTLIAQLAETKNQLIETKTLLAEKETQLAEKETQLVETKTQLAEKETQLVETKTHLSEKETQLVETNTHLSEKETQITTLEKSIESQSLYAALIGAPCVVGLTCYGSLSSHMHPHNHLPAFAKLKNFRCSHLADIESLVDETECLQKLKKRTSELIVKFMNGAAQAENVPVPTVQLPNCPNEAAVVHYVNLGLDDVTAICNTILENAAAKMNIKKRSFLTVRQEMGIFSNRLDHAVVFNLTSNVPVFCIETKKDIGGEFEGNYNNRALGQAFDQLKALQLLGHPRPLSAITCFNKTYVTCLDAGIGWDDVPARDSLQKTIINLPCSPQLDSSPSPFEVIEAVDDERTPHQQSGRRKKSIPGFVADTERRIIRSTNYVDHRQFISALVVLTLNALEENYIPKPFQKLTPGVYVGRPCIEMTENEYKWGTIKTTYKGPCNLKKNPKLDKLYLLRCIGTGITSKAYHAITMDGFDCVVKLYVRRHNENGSMKKKEEFESESLVHVTREVNHYNEIYGEELSDYVWNQKLNSMDCVILPFFQPIEVQDRLDKISDIEDCLKKFTEKNLAFRECDQCWRHVGCFKEKVYLFDLGDLEFCDDAQEYATKHINCLVNKLKTSASSDSTVSFN
jgi:hypothetical protein